MGLKKIRKIFIDNFTENIIKQNNEKFKFKLIYNLENLEVNFYKPKTEVLKEKNGKIIINISYPLNEEFLVKLINSKINFFDKNVEKNHNKKDNDKINAQENNNFKKQRNYKI